MTYVGDVQQQFASHYTSANVTGYRNLTSIECIDAYGVQFLSNRSHVVLVTRTNTTSANDSLPRIFTPAIDSILPHVWMCTTNTNEHEPNDCDLSAVKQNASDWVVNGAKIDYCLSQSVPSRCKLQFVISLLVAVFICNALKTVSMFWTLYKQKDLTLLTVGDAISSFLENPDHLTLGHCLDGKPDTQRHVDRGYKPNLEPVSEPVRFEPQGRRPWFRAASKRRWIITIGLIVVVLVTAISLLHVGLVSADPGSSTRSTLKMQFSTGFGTIDIWTVTSIDGTLGTGGGNLALAVLIANSLQVISSFGFVLYDGLITSLLLSNEWSTYAIRRRPLRVTIPYGQQRSSYYLHLPFRYSVPLIASFAVLHWVISQSLFLARIASYSNGIPGYSTDVFQTAPGSAPDSPIFTYSELGYSNSAILTAILLGGIMLLVALGMGSRRFKSSMPLAGSCSMAIAAACHRPEDDIDAAYLPVQWGEPSQPGLESKGEYAVRHCCFTSHPVELPVPGRMYAGIES